MLSRRQDPPASLDRLELDERGIAEPRAARDRALGGWRDADQQRRGMVGGTLPDDLDEEEAAAGAVAAIEPQPDERRAPRRKELGR